MRIVVKEVRYERLQRPFIGQLEPYLHQDNTLVEVRAAIQNRRTLCIENTSITGSGKTLANFAAAILDGQPTCGVYPTNELIQDQAGALRQYFPDSMQNGMMIVDSIGLDEIQQAIGHRTHSQALDWATGEGNYRALLTNPDVLYLAMYNLYGQMHSLFHAPYGSLAFQNFLNNYPVIVFDEFHLYTPKQIANAAFMIGTAQVLVPNKPHIFIFSSATPQTLFKHYIQRLGIEVRSVSATSDTQGHVVCEPLTIHLLAGDLLRWKGGETIRDNLAPILQWADSTVPPARGVFIVDSVYEARMIAESLRQRYKNEKIGEVHGFMDDDERARSLQCRFSVGTTTIDVGVDLVAEKAKEFLVCEARSAAQAIQRIGRLGRRGREPDTISPPNTVWLVVPDYVLTYIENRVSAGGDPPIIERGRLNDLLNEAYLGHEDFTAYTRKYSPLEAVAACERIIRQSHSDTKSTTKEQLQQLVCRLYQAEPSLTQEQIGHRYKRYLQCQWATWKKFGTSISGSKRHYLGDLESFRGGIESEFTVAIYDERDHELEMKPLKYYNLVFTLRRAECQEMTKQDFIALLEKKHPQQARAWVEELNRQRDLLGYLYVSRLLEGKARRVYFELSQSTIDNGYQGNIYQNVIRIPEGLTIYAEGVNLLRKGGINQALSKRELNCWISERSPLALSRSGTRPLPPLFTIYPLVPFTLTGNNPKQEWSVAFGLNAFLLESTFTRSRWVRKRGGDEAIFC
jgi:CRISPR-associated helicase Cas3